MTTRTKSAMGGQVLDGMIDLALAMVRGQTQLGRHEILLRRQGYIEFEDGTRLELRGRKRINRIAVTLLDWGGVQDRVVAENACSVLKHPRCLPSGRLKSNFFVKTGS